MTNIRLDNLPFKVEERNIVPRAKRDEDED
jgi:hypothetical protein